MASQRTASSVIRPAALQSLLAGALAAVLLVLLAPLAPHAATEGPVDLASWTADVHGNDPAGADWQVAPDGLSVIQAENGPPTLFIAEADAVGVRLEGRIRVLDDNDNDFVGFGFGVHPGDFTNPDADWILIDWKKSNQTYSHDGVSGPAYRGLAVSRVLGPALRAEFWQHRDLDHAASPLGVGLTQLARANTLGSERWETGQTYTFRFEYDLATLRVWVDGVLEFDLAGEFPAGRFAFYNMSQEDVEYSGFESQSLGAASLRWVGDVAAVSGRPAVLAAVLERQLGEGGAVAPVPARFVDFEWGSESCRALTDALGRAECAVTLSADAGTLPARASVPAGFRHGAAEVTAELALSAQPTTLTLTSSAVQAAGVTRVAAVLREDGALPLSGRVVTFEVAGAPESATTDAYGRAEVTLALADGVHPVQASTLATARHLAATATGQVAVLAPRLRLEPVSDAVPVSATLEVTARLLDTGSPRAGRRVLLEVVSGPDQGAAVTCLPAGCLTDAGGAVTFEVASTGRVGLDLLRATLDLDGNGVADAGEPLAEASIQRTGRRGTRVELVGDVAGDLHDAARLAARVLDTESTPPVPVHDAIVELALGALTCTAVTDAEGLAACEVTPAAPAGPRPLTARFTGDHRLLPSAVHDTFEVTREEATLALLNDDLLPECHQLLVAALREDGALPLPGRSVALSFGGFATTLVTGDDGLVRVAHDLPPGRHEAVVTFTGDATHEPATLVRSVVVFADSGFTVWGGNHADPALAVGVGETRTFWGSTWGEQVTAGDFDPAAGFVGHADVVLLDALTGAESSFEARVPRASRPPASCGTPQEPASARAPFSLRCPAAPVSALSAVSRALPASLPDALSVLVVTSVASAPPGAASGDLAGRVVLEVDAPESWSAHPACPASGRVLGAPAGVPGAADYPSQPLAVSAIAGDGLARVEWQPPASSGRRPLTGYVLEVLPAGTLIAVPAAETSRVVTGLANGAVVTFRVTAVSELGPGPASDESAPVTPSDLAGPPANVTLVAGDHSVTVSWVPAPAGGVEPVTGHVVQLAPHDAWHEVPAGVTTLDVSGLPNGIPVHATLRTRTRLGAGPESALAGPALPLGAPTPPRDVAAAAGDGLAVVHWIPPADEGGRAVTRYVVTSDAGAVRETPGDVLTALFEPQPRGVPVTFTVVAHADGGTSAASTPSAAVTPAGPPDAPTALAVSRGNGSVLVAWAPPASDGGLPLTGSLLESEDGSLRVAVPASATSRLVTGLANGTPLAFRVSAVNGLGAGVASSLSALAKPARHPETATILAAGDGDQSATVSWSDVTFDGGEPVQGWQLAAYRVSPLALTPEGAVVGLPAAARSGTVTGLVNGRQYVLMVTAVNAVGAGQESEPSDIVVPARPPDAPRNVVATIDGDRVLEVTWDPPLSNGGSPLLGYTIGGQPGLALLGTSPGVRHVSYSGLTPCTPPYEFTVTAHNRKGAGPAAGSPPTIAATFPGPPLGVTAAAGDRQVLVTWAAPAFDGCAPLQGYKVIASPGGASVTTNAAARQATLTGLVNGTAYTLRVQARNAVGYGALSDPSGSVVPRSLTQLIAFNLAAPWVRGGTQVQATVIIDRPAPAGGTRVTLASSNPSKASVPASVNIASGRTSATFNVSTSSVTAPVDVVLSASLFPVTLTQTLRVRPAPSGPPPVVDLLTPSDLAEVYDFTACRGTVTSASLESWTLSRRLVDGGGWFEVAKGPGPGTDFELGLLDPTLLLNGLHELKLTGLDVSGREASDSIHVIVKGQQKIGHFTLAFADLSVPIHGLPIQLVRTYDSRDPRPGDFGVGWRLSIADVRLERNRPPGDRWNEINSTLPIFPWTPRYCMEEQAPHVVTATLPNGKVYSFRPNFEVLIAGPACWVNRIPAGWITFQPTSGTRGTLKAIAPNGNPATRSQVWAFPVGSEVVLSSTQDDIVAFDPEEYELTTEDGMVLRLTRGDAIAGEVVGGHLKSIQDRAGNRVDITANGLIASPSGVSVPFARDARGYIQTITDPNGRSMRYQQDSNGRLVDFFDRVQQAKVAPAAKLPVEYRYDNAQFPFHLTRVIDQLGQRPVKSIFDDDGRLIRICDGYGTDLDPDSDGRCIDLSGRDISARREVVLDRRGFATLLEYDARGNVLQRTDPDGRTWSFTYTDEDEVETETTPAPFGVATRYEYLAGRVTAVTNETLAQTTRFTWTPTGELLTLQLPGGPQHAWTYTYTPQGVLETERDPLGHGPTYDVGTSGRVRSVTDALGHVTEYSYRRGLLETELDATGVLTTMTRDDNGNVTLVRRSRNGVPLDGSGTKSAYDELDRLTQTWLPDDTPADWSDNPTTRMVYDDAGRLTHSYDELDRVTVTTYDPLGQVRRIDHADGTFETFDYDESGNRVRTTDAAGRVTNLAYDKQDRVQYSWWGDRPGSGLPDTPPEPPYDETGYDEAGRTSYRVDALGHRWDFVHDAADRQTTVVEPQVTGHPQRYSSTTEYDPNGWVRAVIDQRGIRTEFLHDDAGRKTHDVFVDGTQRTYVHDDLDRVVTQLDELGHGPTFGFDPVGRLTSVTDARGKVTSYEHDDLGQLRLQRDALQRVTTFEHDLLGRRKARVLPLGQREEFGYTVTGVMRTHLLFGGGTVVSTPEPLTDRIAAVTYPHDPPVSMTYTPDGMRETVTDARGVTTTTYDPERGWPLTVTQPDGTRLRYGYDDLGNRTLVATRAPGSSVEHVVEYRFDELNRLWKVIEPGGETTTYRYRADGLLETVTYPDYTVGTYTHDDRGRLRSVRWTSPLGAERYRQDITPDAAGRRELVVESMEGVAWRTATHVHDELDRLTSETVVVPGLPTVVRTYAYDDVGNRLHETVTEDGVVVKDVALTYDDNDRLLTAGDLTYAWNVDGTLASITGPAGTTTYTWDDQERLVSATTAAGDALAYGYDADGLRVTRTANGATRRYLYDGSWAHAQVLEERDGTGALSARYTMGHRRIAETRGGARSAYLHDALGSTKALASADGAATVTDTWAYDAFGTIEEHQGASANDFLYAGEQWDPELGMQYLRARWMDPGVGRFGSRDPFEGIPFLTASAHDYLYAAQAPLLLTDAGGMFFDSGSSLAGLGTSGQINRMRTGTARHYITVARPAALTARALGTTHSKLTKLVAVAVIGAVLAAQVSSGARTKVDRKEDEADPERGTIQIQGGDLVKHHGSDTPPGTQYSWPGAPTPHSRAGAVLILRGLFTQLATREQRRRATALEKAVTFIERGPHFAPTNKSFYGDLDSNNWKNTPRIDINVHKGVAFDLP